MAQIETYVQQGTRRAGTLIHSQLHSLAGGLEINRIVTPRDVLTAYDVGEIIQYAGMLFYKKAVCFRSVFKSADKIYIDFDRQRVILVGLEQQFHRVDISIRSTHFFEQAVTGEIQFLAKNRRTGALCAGDKGTGKKFIEEQFYNMVRNHFLNDVSGRS